MTTLIASTNPSDNYALLWTVESSSPEEIHVKLAIARDAQKSWKILSVEDRVHTLRALYHHFVHEKENIAESIAAEMGMPIRLAREEVLTGLAYFLWYLDNAEKYLSPEITFEDKDQLHMVHYEAKWIVAAITPWNYPFMLFIWACIQPLLSGNSVVWKISKEVILTGKLIAAVIANSSLPLWVWTEVYGDGSVGDILTDGDIDMITFTGSTAVGEKLADKAHARGISVVMELGGSAPGIILPDADIDSILETIYFMRYSNSWQMCDGLKRLIVHSSRYDEVVEKLSAKVLSKKIGNASDESVDIWPLVSEKQKEIAEKQLTDALGWGAIILAENMAVKSLKWAYFPLLLLGGVTREMQVWNEEVFAPILPIVTYETLEEAIALANDTPYGLGAYVFTENRELFLMIAARIESGMVQMNHVNYCIPADPFGGYKASGIGREHGRWGFHEFVNVKVLSMPKIWDNKQDEGIVKSMHG